MLNNCQRDPRWKDIKLGFSDTTIGDFGCTITAISDILGTTPDVVNDRLKSVSGFAQGNLVIWAKIEEAFPGVKIRRVWAYDNDDVKANTPNVLVEVDGKPIGGYRHWVVFIGDQRLNDPWTGKERPTSDFPSPLSYCIIGGAWNKPSPTTDLQTQLDEANKLKDQFYNDLQDSLHKVSLLQDENTLLKKANTELEGKIQGLREANDKITAQDADLGVQLLDAQHRATDYEQDLAYLGQVLGTPDYKRETLVKAIEELKKPVEEQVKPLQDHALTLQKALETLFYKRKPTDKSIIERVIKWLIFWKK